MGPQKAALVFLDRHPDAKAFEVTLYGSLAATGKGHLTDQAIVEVLSQVAPVEIVWKANEVLPFHTNGMLFKSFNESGETTDEWKVYSVGGGALSEGKGKDDFFYTPPIYELKSIREIQQWCEKNGRGYWEYVEMCEDRDIWDYLREVWHTMQQSVENGLDNEGALPGPLNLRRKASTYYI